MEQQEQKQTLEVMIEGEAVDVTAQEFTAMVATSTITVTTDSGALLTVPTVALGEVFCLMMQETLRMQAHEFSSPEELQEFLDRLEEREMDEETNPTGVLH